METRSVGVVDLGPDSFFHFGTPKEFLYHFLRKDSLLNKKLMKQAATNNIVNSKVEKIEQVRSNLVYELNKLIMLIQLY